MSTPYQLAINNMKAYFRGDEYRRLKELGDERAFSIFTVAAILSVSFMKDRIEVLADLTTE